MRAPPRIVGMRPLLPMAPLYTMRAPPRSVGKGSCNHSTCEAKVFTSGTGLCDMQGPSAMLLGACYASGVENFTAGTSECNDLGTWAPKTTRG